MVEQRTLIFVIAILYSIEEKWRGIKHSESFENILKSRRGVNLHLAWFTLKKEGLFGEFSNEFSFDLLYNTSNLTEILAKAFNPSGLIRLGGSDFCYHLDQMSELTIKAMVSKENIPSELVHRVTTRLNELLEEQLIASKASAKI